MPHSFGSAYSSAFDVDLGQGHGSWWQLVGILEEAREIDREAASTPPTVCPYDHTTLKPTLDGKLFCPWAGDYTWPDDGIVD